ncbi:MAG: chemotaxis protein CheX [Dehalococcoidia bacterium]|nr:chemotaxis protein CheX [Dehalococcoidia bacterium]
MQASLANPFLAAALEVLEQETGLTVSRGGLTVVRSQTLGQDVTVLIAVTGAAEGIVLYGMSEDTAKGIVSTMMGEPCETFDELAESGIAELGNVITGRASAGLEQAGLSVTISPPTVIRGQTTEISTLDLPRLVVPLETEVGPVVMGVALREGSKDEGPLQTPAAPSAGAVALDSR